MNIVILKGRLANEPTLKYTNSGTQVTSFTVAVKKGKGEAEFIDCVAWKETAEFITQYFTKGKEIAIQGRLTVREWTDRNGSKQRRTEVVPLNVEFCGNKEKTETKPAFEDLDDTEEPLPF